MTTQEITTKNNEVGFVPLREYRANQLREHQQVQTTEALPKDIPIQESGLAIASTQQDIFKIRTQNDEWINSLLRKLAGRAIVENEAGEWVVRELTGVQPLMSYNGAIEVIDYLSMLMNSSVVLSQTDDNTARQVEDELMEALENRFCLEKDYLGLNNTTRETVIAAIRAIVIHQLNRAVRGHESKNLITQVQEQHGEHEVRESRTDGRKGWNWTGSDRR